MKNLSDVLRGALGEPWCGPQIGFESGEFILWTPVSAEEGSWEVMCRHEDWNEFLKLVAEFSDFVGGDV